MSEQNHDEVRGAVRDAYGKVAQGATLGGCKPACCATASESLKLGYSGEELAAVPEGADMGLGCGNPQAIAALQPGETVLDLGCGGGFDCFLAARQVGPTGRVIGVDMTPEMVNKARANARKIAAHNVDFRLGEIEHLPVADGQVDVILSNCVINLSPDKRAVAPFVAMLPSPYREALTLTELEGLTQKDAAAMLGVSLSGMKSRVQRGRTRLREMFNECCEITVDPRGRVIGYEKRPDWKPPGSCCS